MNIICKCGFEYQAAHGEPGAKQCPKCNSAAGLKVTAVFPFQESHVHCLPSVKIVNATPHPLSFLVGKEVISVPPVKGLADVMSADVVEKPIQADGIDKVSISLVTPTFVPMASGKEYIDSIPRMGENRGVLIIGSIIAAQAYGFPVVALVPAPGFERVPPDQKRMRPDKFTVYMRGGEKSCE